MDSIDSEWWTDTLYHPSMTNVTADMALHNVVLDGETIGRVRNGVYDFDLMPHLDDNEYNKMTIQDVRQFLVNKKENVAIINKYNSLISDSASSDGSSSFAAYVGTNYYSDDAIEDNVNANGLESESSESEVQDDEVEDK
eukprot:1913761-Ditylum_brightwellii.AAC.2